MTKEKEKKKPAPKHSDPTMPDTTEYIIVGGGGGGHVGGGSSN